MWRPQKLRRQRLTMLLVLLWRAYPLPGTVHKPAVAVATVNMSASTPGSAVATAVASARIAVHEPPVAVATRDASASAPRSVVAAIASVRTAVHERAVAFVRADVLASAPRIVVAPAVASTGTAVYEPVAVFSSPSIFAPAPHSAPGVTASAVGVEIKLRTAARVGSDAACADTHAFGTHSAHVELAAPCTTTSHYLTAPGSHSPPHPPLPSPPYRPPPHQMSTGSDEDRGSDTYGRRRDARCELSEDEGSALPYLLDGVVDNTLPPRDDTDDDALPYPERGDGVVRPPSSPPRGRAPCCSRSWSHLDRPAGAMWRCRPSNRRSHRPPALPPIIQGTLTEDHWQSIPGDVRHGLCLRLGTGAGQE